MSKIKDKIIELLQNKHDAFLGTEGQKARDDFKQGLAWAINTVETIFNQETEWISVDDRLPVDEIVIATTGYETQIVSYNPESMDWEISEFERLRGGVTHWMPLPESPNQ